MIIALHGFLGLPQDWTPFAGAFRDREGRAHVLRQWNLYGDLPEQPPSGKVSPLRKWAQSFCDRMRADQNRGAGEAESMKPILLGYSMGGRLALHALLHDPNLFSAAVIVAAHPGLAADDMRAQRRLNDAQWAERFRREEWSALIAAWGAQEVFRKTSVSESDHLGEQNEVSRIELPRLKIDFDRTKLARAMLAWSLAEQDNLRTELADLQLPILWVTGAHDRKFNMMMREMMVDFIDSPMHSWVQIPQAGHRVPWDNSVGFVDEVQQFLNRLR